MGVTGGNLQIFAARTVEARDVIFEGGRAEAGGAVLVRDGTVTLERCRIRGNQGKLAQAVWVYHQAQAALRDCVIVGNLGDGPAVAAPWGARLRSAPRASWLK